MDLRNYSRSPETATTLGTNGIPAKSDGWPRWTSLAKGSCLAPLGTPPREPHAALRRVRQAARRRPTTVVPNCATAASPPATCGVTRSVDGATCPVHRRHLGAVVRGQHAIPKDLRLVADAVIAACR